MNFIPAVFIGSSTEGLPIAKKVEALLNKYCQCTIWTDAFSLGVSNYDNLASKIALYDYAILIATADDVLTSRGDAFDVARDNVLFEFGLFAGGLGRSRVFYLIEKECKIPSDLSGITLPMMPPANDPTFDRVLEGNISKVLQAINDKENTFDLGFLPSTTLAYGYFINFVERTVERLLEDKNEQKVFHLENGQTFKISNLKFTILIPNDLSDDMFSKVKAKRLKDGWKKLKVDPKDVRDYDFSIDVTKVDEGLLHLVDIPFTLNALNKAIDLYARKEHFGKDAKEALLEYREIRNFKRMLEYLISKSSLARGIVTIEVVDI